uniref:Uncharacterized protein n=1 Tax=Candidatus Kentrum sp. DK TaxID=2126562 RepID=A0A450T1L4_9GAMM|nr:MAG: hypothetical protein BECKDK2373C_GA0170839_108024 [Candidatus Kentron sp. DK]
MNLDQETIPAVSGKYARDGRSTKTDELGMRPMQERAHERRGKRMGFTGDWPGLVEEAIFALETDQPIYLAGGFGGVTLPRIWSGRSVSMIAIGFRDFPTRRPRSRVGPMAWKDSPGFARNGAGNCRITASPIWRTANSRPRTGRARSRR